MRHASPAAQAAPSHTERKFHICKDHKNADWNQPRLEADDCILCTLFYLEAQESLLEEWQQRAKRAEADLAETKRPLDEQMARLNDTVTRLNGELAAALSAIVPTKEAIKAAQEWDEGKPVYEIDLNAMVAYILHPNASTDEGAKG